MNSPIRPFRSQRERGQAMVEYAIICAVLAVCLFGTPVGRLLAEALRDFYGSLIFFLSLP
jgi:Flp pilus assembly pilin Flp